jgi:hypothetical protein
LKGALEHALKASISLEERQKLEEFMNSLPADVEDAGAGE